MRTWSRAVLALSCVAAAPAPGGKVAPPAPSATVAAPAAGAQPQSTTATFGDWTLRCSRPAGAAKMCELAQLVQRDGKPIAEMAIGSAAGQRLQFTLLVPPSVTFAQAPALTLSGGDGAGGEGAGLTLTWRRCVAGGCIANAEIGDEMLSRMRGWTQPGRVVFGDGAGRPTAVPVSPAGLAQALDALAKEDAG